MPTIVISLAEQFEDNINGTICRGKVCGHKIEGIDCGSDVSEWLSLSLGRPNLRLIRQTKKIINKGKLLHFLKPFKKRKKIFFFFFVK